MYTEAVQRLVEQEEKDESDRAMYISAINDLLEVIREVYRKVSAGKTGLHLMHLLIGWLYRQPEEL
jgi:dihydrodipicolinate synthase/N-acetylneuraminate lyase